MMTWLALLVGAYVAYCAIVYVAQRSLLFPGGRPGGDEPTALESHPEAQVSWLETSVGRVETWYIPSTHAIIEPRPAVILAHGNAELIDTFPAGFRRFLGRGIDVLLVEYPGYGRSEGSSSETSITEAMTKAYDELVARKKVDGSQVIGLGRSLGGGAICALAEQRDLAALILVSTFTNIPDIATSRYFVPGHLARDHFDNVERVKGFNGAVLVIHSPSDELIPFSHAEKLVGVAKRGTLISYDCDHGACPPDWEAFWHDVGGFLRDQGIGSDV
ncbi:MAG: alpha/beta hydrolase [Candidatus Latescibacterota bacterium]|nr:alpha/beta hydrolase [Candidatus Latescibacterota bacterium]